MTKTPSVTIKIPSQRTGGICSPRNIKLAIGTMTWVAAARLNAISNGTERRA